MIFMVIKVSKNVEKTVILRSGIVGNSPEKKGETDKEISLLVILIKIFNILAYYSPWC